MTPEDFDAALELYEKAIQLDPEFALAHALAARIHYARVMLGWADDAANEIQIGLRFAERATSIDAKPDYGHVMRAGLLNLMGRYRDEEDAARMTGWILFVGHGWALKSRR